MVSTYKNLCESTNSVLARHIFYSHIQEKEKRGLNYFYNFSSFLILFIIKNLRDIKVCKLISNGAISKQVCEKNTYYLLSSYIIRFNDYILI